MMKSKFGRAGVLVSGVAMTVAAAAMSTGTAAADTDGGCGGPAYANVCISMDGGTLNYAGYTNFANGATGTIHLWLWDYTEKAGGVRVFTTDFPAATGPHHYRPGGLADPTPGHDYKAEMRVQWGNVKTDTYLSPDMFA
ncbi:hypothetical protein [Nocardia macrotermitis]|uniref:Secreted protein n=1 Tax=Nocardia macrotermitis TaxID=2585198 RepID=A0A7K0CWI5_9NOCA|nr:hypothetical protein [Nocardia macrotermitis]MQY17771.1 hypothetical protein [Nocardia macrotermitis]